MNTYFFTFLALLSAQLTFAQKEVSTGAKSQRLYNVLSEEHISPSKLSLDFAGTVHMFFLDRLDSDSSIFNESDRVLLNEFIDDLEKDIETGNQVYFDYTIDLYLKKVNAITSRTNELIDYINVSKSYDSETKKVATIVGESFDHHIWHEKIRSQLTSLITEKCADQNYEHWQDSLNNFLAESRNELKKRYTDYSSNVKTAASLFEEYYLNAIAESFDPHSSFLSFGSVKEFEQELSSEREVYGIEYQRGTNGNYEISHLLPGGSAWLSGAIHVGDQITGVQFGNDKKVEISSLTQFQLGQLFKNASSKELTLTIIDESGETKEVKLVKSKVYSDTDIIKSAVLSGEKRIGYISLPDFYSSWTDTTNLGCANDVAKALLKLKQENVEGVILDLRDNGGGSLKEAIDLTGIFIDYGPVMLYTDDEKKANTMKDFNRGSIYNGPLMILINEYSASASEVVAGALQDHGRALILGRRSYGKATGQYIRPMDPKFDPLVYSKKEPDNNWGFVKLTRMGLYRIDLTSNQRRGVVPDIELNTLDKGSVLREEDYKNSLTLGPIDKKTYYTKSILKSFDEAKQNNLARTTNDTWRKQNDSFINDLDVLYADVNTGKMILSDYIQVEIKKDEILKKWKDFLEDYKSAFNASSLSYDQEVYKLNPILNDYMKDFLRDVSRDAELDEVYHIMLDWLK